MKVFEKKIAIVTGGASGIGRAICEELASAGAVVVAADVNVEGAERVALLINEAGGHARAARVDVRLAEDVLSLVTETVAEHGRLDYMFNNAGTNVAGEVRDLRLEHWQRIVNTNLWGVVHGTTAAYSFMVKQGSGHIVNTASLAGLTGLPTNTPYAATKHAVVGLSSSLRVEAAGLGIKVSVVCPSFVQTRGIEALTVLNANREDLTGNIPLKPISPTHAAKQILRGVAANRAIIVFPFYARAVWWLWRLNSSLLVPVGTQTVRKFRAARTEP
jgi:NAD(P)-dependent dehydrogenase (short-subunit alcohol dehydrogenase family)